MIGKNAAVSPVTLALAGLSALAVAMGIGRFSFTPILPMMINEGSLTIVEGSFLASLNYSGYLVGALLAVAFPAPHSVAIRAGLLAICLLTFGMALDLTMAGWMGLRFLAGIASAWVLISISGWCLQVIAPWNRPALTSLVFAGTGTGIAIAGLLCIFVTGASGGARVAWLASALVALLSMALSWRCFGTDRGATVVAGPTREARWGLEHLRLISAYGASGFGYIIPATYLPVMAGQTVSDPALIGLAWPIFGAASALLTIIASRLIAAIGPRRVWAGCHLLMAFGVVAPLMMPGLAGVLVSAVLVGGLFMINTLAAVQEARSVAAGGATRLIAGMTSAFAAGQIAGPALIAYLVERGVGFRAGLIAASLVLAAGALAILARSPPPEKVARERVSATQGP